jgi:hypothetical protein
MTEPKKRGRKPKTETVETVETVVVADVSHEVALNEALEIKKPSTKNYTNTRKGRFGVGSIVFEAGETLALTQEQIESAPFARAIEQGILKA